MHNSAIQYNTIQHEAIQYNPIQYNPIQYTTMEHKTIQYNTRHVTYKKNQHSSVFFEFHGPKKWSSAQVAPMATPVLFLCIFVVSFGTLNILVAVGGPSWKTHQFHGGLKTTNGFSGVHTTCYINSGFDMMSMWSMVRIFLHERHGPNLS